MDQEQNQARSNELPCADGEVAAVWESVPAHHQQIGNYQTAVATRSVINFGISLKLYNSNMGMR